MNIRIESSQFMEGQENPPGTIRAYPPKNEKKSIDEKRAVYIGLKLILFAFLCLFLTTHVVHLSYQNFRQILVK